ncbi:tRNA pseudouridine synthase D family protein [Cryptosporidium felis]|nr:tRNA pseudouridine synthase D family protein [Cryptosporidium felis]
MQVEKEHGICEFIRPSKIKLKGTIKKYFEDFHVHEVQKNGNICNLTEIRNKHEIIEEIKEKNNILTGNNIFDNFGFKINPEFTCKLEELGVSRSCTNEIKTFITLLGEIKKLTINNSINNKLFKFDSNRKLKSILEMKCKLQCPQYGDSSNNVMLPNYFNNDTKSESNSEQKEKRRQFHKLIKDYIPFVTSRTVDKKEKINSIIDLKVTQFKNITISTEILNEISKFIKIEDLEQYNLNSPSGSIHDHENEDLHFDTIVLQPSSDFVYSLRNSNKMYAKKSDYEINNMKNDLLKPNEPSCKKLKVDTHKDESDEFCINSNFCNIERWDPNIPDYIHFTIYKENRDTIDAINMISKCIKRDHKFFGIAGLKDRRGITIQRVSLYRTLESQLIYSTASKNWDRNIRICDFKYENSKLNIGDLQGNIFHVVIRNLKLIENEFGDTECNEVVTLKMIDELVKELKLFGFVNYFGLQRFGTCEIPTYKIGIALLKKEWRKAYNLILGFDKEKVESYSFEKKNLYNQIMNNDYSTYLNNLTNHSYLEKLVVNGFIKEDRKRHKQTSSTNEAEDIYKHSINKLPKNSYSLYLHSVQSLFFNIIASERIKKFGKSPTIGDLVIYTSQDDLPNKTDMASEQNITIIKSESDINKFTIKDVVLTLPGDCVIYPPNMEREYENLMRVLLDLNLTSDNLGIAGSYRNIVVIPEHVDYVAFNINENDFNKQSLFPDSKVILSDLDVLTTFSDLKPKIDYFEPIISPEISSYRCDDKESSIVNTIVFSCKLPKSSYVTVALRELLGNFPCE